ncbi:dipeptide ABC transporter ATP-binding protein [Streptomyces sp. NPDC001840]
MNRTETPAVTVSATEPTGDLLSVRRLQVRTGTGSGGRILVHDVDFDLAPGQTLGIVGESGSGKSMTVRALLGILPDGIHATGEARFDGHPLIGATERDLRRLRGRRISMVLQDPFTSLNPLQTTHETIHESLPKAVRRDRAAARAEIARRLSEVGLDPDQIADRYPFQLSGGMRQRVAIAAALAGDPEVLIADEPTTALDATTQADILNLLTKLQRDRGMALVLITHDLRVAFSICDQIMVMYAGSIIEAAPGAELARSPRHPYSLGLLLAEPPASHLVEQLSSIPGNVPPADEVQHTCPFAARCDWHQPACSTARPPLVPVSADRRSACLRADHITGDLIARRDALVAPLTPPDPPEGPAIVSVSHVTKTYRTTSLVARAGTVHAVQDVSFSITDGEALGLVGETGSGKTTLARCLLGLATPTSGSIHVGDHDVSDYRRLSRNQRRAVRRFVQVVFQDPYAALNPMLTIGAALREAISSRGESHAVPGEIAELLAMVGLPEKYAERRPSALSGGERQRVAIARALAVRPKLLICDEPVAALDVSVQAQILELLREIRRSQGTSMLFITHDLSVVRQMTDRTIVLRHGRIVEEGATPAVLDTPKHPYTIKLVRSTPGHEPGPDACSEI